MSSTVSTQPIAVLSHALPPSVGGQSTVLGRLFSGEGCPPVRFLRFRRNRPEWSRLAHAWAGVQWKLRRVRPIQASMFRAMLAGRAEVLARELSKADCAVVIGCTGGDLLDIPTSVEAARLAGIPAHLYYFDDYRLQWMMRGLVWRERTRASLAAWAEEIALHGASGVIAPNESMETELRSRTGVPVMVVRNPVDLGLYERLRRPGAEGGGRERGEVRVVYTGGVYEAQSDALRNCAMAIERLMAQGMSIGLHVYTLQSRRGLRRAGLPGSVRLHGGVHPDEAARIQCTADVLLLALSFSSSYPDLIRTSAPAKLGECLAAGRPLLVHAPSGSFAAEFSEEHRCAEVCDTPSVDALSESIARLVLDASLRERLSVSALAASQEFCLERNRYALWNFLRHPDNLRLRTAVACGRVLGRS